MNRGEIWWAVLDPTVGSEITKTRPVVIISSDKIGILPVKVVVPTTSWHERFKKSPWMVELLKDETTRLPKDSFVDALQIRCVSIDRLSEKIGTVPESKMSEITKAVKIVIRDTA